MSMERKKIEYIYMYIIIIYSPGLISGVKNIFPCYLIGHIAVVNNFYLYKYPERGN
jgi:hypothetical protein